VSGDIRPDRPAALSVGLLRPCILAHLISGQSVYGYELHHWLLGIGLECDLGTVYRSLNTMESEGLLHSTWERTAGGRSRRRYELNDAGLDMVDAYVGPVEQLCAVAQEFLAMRRGGAGSHPSEAPTGGSTVVPLATAAAPLSIPARRG
jgi:PadR family transcriptional regulator, regulatory protein PadR